MIIRIVSTARPLAIAASLNLVAVPAVPAFTTLTLLLAGCTTKTVNGVTTVQLNVASMNAWGQALVNGAQLISTLPGVAGTTPAAAISTFGPMISADMTAFDTATNGMLTFTYDTTSPATQVTSIVNDAQKLEAAVTQSVSQIPAAAISDFNQYSAAISTIVALIQAAISTVQAASTTVGGMTEAEALKVLKVTK